MFILKAKQLEKTTGHQYFIKSELFAWMRVVFVRRKNFYVWLFMSADSIFNRFRLFFPVLRISAVFIPAALFCGCGRQAPPPPVERAELVERFFKSIENNDVDTAMRQGIKLRAIDNHNENVVRLVEIQQCNAFIVSAQKKINSGDIRGAVTILQQGVKQYPDNVTLRNLLPKVRQLRNARSLIAGMQRASNSIAMRSALTAAKIGLSLNHSPALLDWFARYEKKTAQLEKLEKAAAAEAAAKLKKEPVIRSQEKNKKVQAQVVSTTQSPKDKK